MSVGQRLRWLLDLEGRSIKDLSKASSIPYRTIQQYLADKRKPGTDHLIKLAESGIDLHWLLLGQEEAALKLLFPGFEPLDGPLAADSELAAVFLQEALDAVDEFHRDCVNEEGKPLELRSSLAAVWYVFSFYDRMLKQIADVIIEKRKEGWSCEDLAKFILTDPVRERIRSGLLYIDKSAPAAG